MLRVIFCVRWLMHALMTDTSAVPYEILLYVVYTSITCMYDMFDCVLTDDLGRVVFCCKKRRFGFFFLPGVSRVM